jgi:hypothetical protein
MCLSLPSSLNKCTLRDMRFSQQCWWRFKSYDAVCIGIQLQGTQRTKLQASRPRRLAIFRTVFVRKRQHYRFVLLAVNIAMWWHFTVQIVLLNFCEFRINGWPSRSAVLALFCRNITCTDISIVRRRKSKKFRRKHIGFSKRQLHRMS